METIRRTPLSEHTVGGTQQQTQRANRSATQWLFNPYSIADTSNWAVTTGINRDTPAVGKVNIGGLTKVTNVTENITPNKTKKSAESVSYDSTFNFTGYVENERFALNIANEIVNNFPRRIHRIKALEGMDDNKQVEAIQTILLGAEMPVAHIEGESEPVPVLPQMREILRANMTEIAHSNSPQKALLLAVGKEFESAIADNIKLAQDDLKVPQQDVQTGKRAGFDVNAQRNFLALGKPVPDTLKREAGGGTSAKQYEIQERTLDLLENLNNLMTGGAEQIEGEVDETTVTTTHPEPPDDFVTQTDANQIAATTPPVEAEMEFIPAPSIVETKPLTDKQMTNAEKKEAAKVEDAVADEKDAEAAELLTDGDAPAKEAAEKKTSSETESTTPHRCQATTGSGEQCKNDALEKSDFCHLEAHRKQGKKKSK